MLSLRSSATAQLSLRFCVHEGLPKDKVDPLVSRRIPLLVRKACAASLASIRDWRTACCQRCWRSGSKRACDCIGQPFDAQSTIPDDHRPLGSGAWPSMFSASEIASVDQSAQSMEMYLLLRVGLTYSTGRSALLLLQRCGKNRGQRATRYCTTRDGRTKI
jgi:hypothetical protein